ncbi:MAG TPA: hypothetical protein VFZ69_04810 [Longimicrobiales bacterium]
MRNAGARLTSVVLLATAACDMGYEPVAPVITPSMHASAAQSEHRELGGPFTGAPFWALLADGFLPHTDDYAILPFIRQLEGTGAQVCGFSAPDLTELMPPVAFSCPLTVAGFEHWQDGHWDDGLPWDGQAPRQTHHMSFGAVPIVFVEWDSFQQALGDDDSDGDLDLSGAELRALVDDGSALIGYASSYQSANILGLSGPQGIGNGKYTITARGTLEDGTSFRLRIADSPGVTRRVHLSFGE